MTHVPVQRYYTKTFFDAVYSRQLTPGQWEEVPRGRTNDCPLDQQINEFLDSTGYDVISTSALAIHHSWTDREMQTRCTVFGLTIIYMAPQGAWRAAGITDEVAHGAERFVEAEGESSRDQAGGARGI